MIKSFPVNVLLINNLGKVSRKVVALTSADTPTGLAIEVIDENTLRLTWNDISLIEDGYSIERSTDGIIFAEIDTVLSNVETFDDTTCDEGTRYWYRVRGFKGASYTEYSGTVNAYTILVAPTLLAIAIINDNTLRLTWNDNSSAEESYKIEKSISGGAFSVINTTAANAETYDDTDCEPDIAYTYRIRAYKNPNYSEYTSEVSETIDEPQYRVFEDENGLLYRKGIRSNYIVTDVAITVTGFSGTEDIDWINIDNTPIPI